MAKPDQTLELSNSTQMPPLDVLDGQELIPARSHAGTPIPVSITPEVIADYALGSYTYQLTSYTDPIANASKIMMVENGKTYTITIDDIINLANYTPTDITSMISSPNVSEIGSSVSSIVLNWTIDRTVLTQSLSPFSGSLTAIDRSATVTGPFTTNQTWTLQSSDGKTTDTATASLTFRNKRYWGVSPDTTLTNGQILLLSSEFTTSKVKSVSYNATGGRYVYYCYPLSYGLLSNVKVGGLTFTDFTSNAINLTNASGHTEAYYLVRINNIQSGSNIQVDWA